MHYKSRKLRRRRNPNSKYHSPPPFPRFSPLHSCATIPFTFFSNKKRKQNLSVSKMFFNFAHTETIRRCKRLSNL